MRCLSCSYLLWICCLLLFALNAGCGRSTVPPPPPTGSALIESFKTQLAGVIETGEGGSGLDSLAEEFKLIQQEKPETAAVVADDVRKLLIAATPEQRKELATQIRDKLSL